MLARLTTSTFLSLEVETMYGALVWGVVPELSEALSELNPTRLVAMRKCPNESRKS